MRTQRAYYATVKKAIILAGGTPIKAFYDDEGNCIYCGEAGNCPGWHPAIKEEP